jgi:hypothetical protein
MKRRWQAWFLPHKKRQRPYLLTPQGFFVLSLSVSFIYLVLLASTYIPGIKNILGYASDITVSEVLTRTNQEREKSGQEPLTLNGQLSQAALAKAQDMLAQGYWAHNTPEGKEPWAFIDSTGYRYQVAGENLARNFSHTDDMVSAWLTSPTHRANLLSDRYSETGIAVLQGEMDGVPTTLVVQMFGTPQRAIADIATAAETASVTPASTPQPERVDLGAELPEETNIPAPLPRPQGEGDELLLGTESEIRDALISPDNVLQTPYEPIVSPATAFRIGIFLLSGGVILVIAYDYWKNQNRRFSLRTAKHVAHLFFLLSVLLTLALTNSGRLL